MNKYKAYIALAFLGAIALVLTFSATAMAATAVAPADGSWTDLLTPVYNAFRAGHYVACGALAVVLLVSLLKKYAPGKLGTFIGGKVGSTVSVLVASFAGSIAATASAGDSFTLSMVETAGTVAAAAAGGYTILKDLIVDPLVASSWYKNKAPTWLKAGMSLVLWIFDKPTGAAEIAKAEAAGAAAVAAKPAEGTSAPAAAGKPTDL